MVTDHWSRQGTLKQASLLRVVIEDALFPLDVVLIQEPAAPLGNADVLLEAVCGSVHSWHQFQDMPLSSANLEYLIFKRD